MTDVIKDNVTSASINMVHLWGESTSNARTERTRKAEAWFLTNRGTLGLIAANSPVEGPRRGRIPFHYR